VCLCLCLCRCLCLCVYVSVCAGVIELVSEARGVCLSVCLSV